MLRKYLVEFTLFVIASGAQRAEREERGGVQRGRGSGAGEGRQEAEGGQQPEECHLAALVAEAAALQTSVTASSNPSMEQQIGRRRSLQHGLHLIVSIMCSFDLYTSLISHARG